MSHGRTLAPHRPELVSEGPAAVRPRWLAMAMSSDHKDVGRLYIGASFSFLALGIAAYLLIRLQLAVPENNLIEPVTFNRLLSVGSATLIVLFALPFAFIAMILAAGGWPGWWVVGWVTAAMVGGRTCAMAAATGAYGM